ncbi:MAG: ABC transporter permease subunit [Collinsella sp.]
MLVRNALEGIRGVDPALIEAARGMGLSDSQVLLKVQLPLALPAIIAGVRLACISTVGIATIAAAINAGWTRHDPAQRSAEHEHRQDPRRHDLLRRPRTRSRWHAQTYRSA